MVLLAKLIGADYATVKRTLAKPQNAILLLLLVLSGIIHMRLGMQSIIEDYVHSEGRKVMALMLNSVLLAGGRFDLRIRRAETELRGLNHARERSRHR